MVETPIHDWNIVVAILFSLMAILLLGVFFLIKVQIAFANRKKAKLVNVSEFDNNKWKAIDSGNTLRLRISTEMFKEYYKKLLQYHQFHLQHY